MADAHTASNAKRQMADAYGAPNAKRQRRFKRKKFACMVFGTVGDGKSMLSCALAAPAEDQPDGDVPNAKFATAGGVTKLVKGYLMTPEIADFLDVEQAIMYDTPGVGDKHAKMSEVVGKVHAMVQGGVELNCIIMTNKSGDGRVSPGMRMVSDILKRAFVKDKSKIVVALTKCDEQKPKKIRQAKKMIERELAESDMFGGAVTVVPVAIPPLEQPDTGDDTVEREYPDKENEKYNILDLLKAMRERVEQEPMNFVEVDMNVVAEEQLKRTNEKYIEAMKNKEKEKMKKMEAKFVAEAKKSAEKTVADMQRMKNQLEKAQEKKMKKMQAKTDAKMQSMERQLREARAQANRREKPSVGDVLLAVGDAFVPGMALRHLF